MGYGELGFLKATADVVPSPGICGNLPSIHTDFAQDKRFTINHYTKQPLYQASAVV